MAERKVWAYELQVQYNASVVKCCHVVGISRTAYYSCQRSTKTDPLLTQIRSIKSDPPFHLGMAPGRRLSFNR